ncbi:metallophosphoesterase [Desulfovibrio sp. OttesenSCG-928-G15]|nr:metallophosphoesterase [Desulfovibrio sp. OttesenSCG-928-G15]
MEPYWVAFGDIHENLDNLTNIPEIAGAQGVLVTGDITFAGGISQAAKVLEPIIALNPTLYAQIGNMDRSQITGWLEDRGWNLHVRSGRLFPGVYAIGVGGSTPTPFNTPSEFSEKQLAAWLEEAHAEAVRANGGQAPYLVLVSHTPPRDSACDKLSSGASAGSVAVREFIEKHQPALCLCGHIHESVGEDHIGNTHVINPGDLQGGGYVLVRKQGDSVTGELKTARLP